MKTFRIKHVDAFTSERFAGNPAAVVLDAQGLDDARMQQIAREMNLSETAFILPGAGKSDLQIRWFTPLTEVPLCGHATIASFHALAEEKMFGMKKPGVYNFRVLTRKGILPVTVEKKFSGTMVEFGLPTPRFVEKRPSPRLLDALGVRSSDLERRFPVVEDSYLYLPLRNLSALARVRPADQRLSVVSKAMQIIGVCLFTLETVEESSAVHSRFFAPAVGLHEDPVTGSANGPLGSYLYRYVLPKGIPVPLLWREDGKIEFIGEQGDEIGRAGRVKIRLRVHKGESVSIAGEAITVMNSTLQL
jgi:trans-2,3-dihydro-3-hydroxyanthranilate isomerase